MDLHDDIGSSLTRISVLSEVARHQESQPGDAQSTLNKIGETARELIGSLSDIVWSVDPSKDDLQNAIRRIAQFGEDTCEGRHIAFATELQEDFSSARLTLEQRRELFLLFKEAITNAVKHSKAHCVTFRVGLRNKAPFLQLLDDGTGFDPGGTTTGNGIRSMRHRAGQLGTLRIECPDDGGTDITLTLKTG
jgi:signal transduction histidine kinase